MKSDRKPKCRGRKVRRETRKQRVRFLQALLELKPGDEELLRQAKRAGVTPAGVTGEAPIYWLPAPVSPASIHSAFGIHTRIIPRYPDSIACKPSFDYHPDMKRYKRCVANFRYLAERGVFRAG